MWFDTMTSSLSHSCFGDICGGRIENKIKVKENKYADHCKYTYFLKIYINITDSE